MWKELFFRCYVVVVVVVDIVEHNSMFQDYPGIWSHIEFFSAVAAAAAAVTSYFYCPQNVYKLLIIIIINYDDDDSKSNQSNGTLKLTIQ